MVEKAKNKIAIEKSEEVTYFVKEEYKKFLKLNYIDSSPEFYEILKNKIDGQPLRARFAYFLFQYLKEEVKEGFFNKVKKKIKYPNLFQKSNIKDSNEISEQFFTHQFPFILEVIISIQYYHNQILDEKSGIETEDRMKDNLVISNLLKGQLFRYIDVLDLSNETKYKLNKFSNKIFELVDNGQKIEKSYNNYQSYSKMVDDKKEVPTFKKLFSENIDAKLLNQITNLAAEIAGLDGPHRAYLKLYFQRIYLTNASLFQETGSFLANLLKVSKRKSRRITQFATITGLMLQMVNDNNDFIPSRFMEETAGKDAEDAFSDLRNLNITLPLLIHLGKKKIGAIANFLLIEKHRKTNGKSSLSLYEERKIFEDITESEAIYLSMKIPKEIKKGALKLLNKNNAKINPLIKTLSSVDNNRFYWHFYEKEEEYKKYKKNNSQVANNFIQVMAAL